MNETRKNGANGNGDGSGSNGSGVDDDFDTEITAVTDTASLHLIRAGRAIVKHGHAGARFGEAVGGIGLDLRWSGESKSKRVLALIAAQDKVKKARDAYAQIVEILEDIDRMVENEANSLHLEEEGP